MKTQADLNTKTDSNIKQSRQSGMKNSSHDTQSNVNKLQGKNESKANINQETVTGSGIRGQGIHKKTPEDFARHTRDVKPESDYKRGAQDEVGQDMRRSRQKATQFQEDLANDE